MSDIQGPIEPVKQAFIPTSTFDTTSPSTAHVGHAETDSMEKAGAGGDAAKMQIPVLALLPPNLSDSKLGDSLTNLHNTISNKNWEHEIISNMWDKYSETIATIGEQRVVDARRDQIQQVIIGDEIMKVDLQGKELIAQRNAIETLASMSLQHLANATTLHFFLNSPKYVGVAQPELRAAQELSKIAASSLTNVSFNRQLREYATARIDKIYGNTISGVAKEALADKWIAITRATIAFTALGIVRRAEVSGGGGGGTQDILLDRSSDSSRQILRYELLSDLSKMRESMSKEEINEVFTDLEDHIRYGSTEHNGAMAVMRFIASTDPHTNHRDKEIKG